MDEHKSDLFYRDDIYKEVKKTLDEFAYHTKIPNGLYGKIMRSIENAKSSFWNPCTNEDNVPQKGEEVLVSLEYPNGKKEIAFCENYGYDIDTSVAFWGGQNNLVRAWAKMPEPYGEDK